MDDRNENLNNLNNEHLNNTSLGSKAQQFFQKTKKAVKSTLMATGMATSTIGGVTTPNIMPATIETIIPAASTGAKLITLGTAAALATACEPDTFDFRPDTVPTDTISPLENDTIPPEINILHSSIDITGGKQISIQDDNKCYVGDLVVASWSDNDTLKCDVSLSLDGQNINSGDTLYTPGVLGILVSDKSGNSQSAEIQLTADISPIFGLESLNGLNMQVGQPVNLMNGITFGTGVSLVKVEVEINGERLLIADPHNFVPPMPGTCKIIFTVSGSQDGRSEIPSTNLTIRPLNHTSFQPTNIQPASILPVINQLSVNDMNELNHINHLRIAEATRMRDMMWTYGAGNYTPEQYQTYMSRLNVGMIGEYPTGYNNYTLINTGASTDTPTDHARNEWSILITILDHANFYVLKKSYQFDILLSFCQGNQSSNNQGKINIFGLSMGNCVDRTQYDARDFTNIDLCVELDNFILFKAGSNVNGSQKKICHENINPLPDTNSVYEVCSHANGSSDNASNLRHMLVTVGTNASGNVNVTTGITGSKFPVGFHNDVLFAGRTFPYGGGPRVCEGGRYVTSFTNYTNVAMTSLLFQLSADVLNVDTLLNRIRNTSLTDHITYGSQTQALHLINPAGYIKAYLMPNSLPTQINSGSLNTTGDIIPLQKGFYKGVIFNIPGAEVKINGQRIAYNNANRSQIMSQNPFNLEWRLNGELCKKLGYKGRQINGSIIVVDDQMNGLSIDKPVSIMVN